MRIERDAHAGAIDALHRAPVGGGDLQQVGHPAHLARAVGSRGVEQGRIEESGVALGERQLHMVRLEVIAELGPPRGEIAGQIGLRERQVERRSGSTGMSQWATAPCSVRTGERRWTWAG